MKNKIKLLVLITFLGLFFNSNAQRFGVKIRVDSVYAEVAQSGGTAHPVWRLSYSHTGTDFHSFNPIACFDEFGGSDSWHRQGRIIYDREYISILDNNQYYIRLRGWEDDRLPVCDYDGPDDHECTSSNHRFVFNYNNFPPNEWIQVMLECSGGSPSNYKYMVSLSVQLTPPKVDINNIVVRKKGSPFPETNFCRNDSIELSVNPAFFNNIPGISEEDFNFKWEYSSSKTEYCPENNILVIDEEAYQQIASEYWIIPCEVPDGWHPFVYECFGCDYYYYWAQYGRVSEGINNPMVFPVGPGDFDFKRFRVTLFTKSDAPYFLNPGIVSDATPDIFIFNSAPTLPLDQQPPTDSNTLTSAADAIFSNDYFTIEHVTCNGGGGRISIKKMGSGLFYTLEDQNSDQTWVINGGLRSAPSPGNPIVFPDHFDPNQIIPAGEYVLLVENQSEVGGGLCSSEFPITIREPDQISFLAEPVARGAGNPHAISCFGQQDGSIAITPMGGVGPYDISLTGIDSFEGQSQLVTFSGLFAQTNYTLSVKDIFGCSQVGTVGGLTEPLPLEILEPQLEYFGPDSEYNIKCFGEEGLVSILTEGDDFERHISIDGQIDQIITNDSEAASFSLKEGTYQVTASYPFGCSETVSITLTEPENFQISIEEVIPATCVNGERDSDGSVLFSLTGGVPKDEGYTAYLLDRPEDVSTGTTFSATNLRTQDYQVVIEDKFCTTENTLSMPPNPNRIKYSDVNLLHPGCYGYQTGSVHLSAKSGNPFGSETYLFKMEGLETEGPLSEKTYDQLAAGSYIFTISDSEGCFQDTTLIIFHPDSLSAIFEFVPNLCPGESQAEMTGIVTGGISPYHLEWRNIDGDLLLEEVSPSSSSLNNLKAGRYNLYIKDANGCTNAKGNKLIVPFDLIDPPQADLGEDKAICEGAPVTLESNLEGSYSWSYNDNVLGIERSISVTDPGKYHLMLTDMNGCITEDDVIVFINNDVLVTNFLMLSEAYVGDTILLIDVSQPAPTHLNWTCPQGVQLISFNPPYAELIFDTNGIFNISLLASLGGCSDEYINQVTILEGTRPESGGRFQDKDIIKSFRLSPNPTNGHFVVEVELHEPEELTLQIVAGDGRKLVTEYGESQKFYTWDFSLENNLSAGLYFVTIQVAGELQVLRLIIN